MRLRGSLAALALVASLTHAARADEARALSRYEAESLRSALVATHGSVDPDPEGKIVEGIDIVPLEVIEDRDPAPNFLNVFHATTRKDILRREVLLAVGERYRQYRVDETVRDLRGFQQLSLVLAVATRGTTADRVRVLVITKDVWSLRSQFEIKLGSGGLDLLRVEPTERNIAGTLDSAVTRLELLPETLTLGAAYYVPRLAGRSMYFVSEANVVFERHTGAPEGTFASVSVFKPQLSADTAWVWQIGGAWSNVVSRRYVDAKLATFDAPSTPEEEHVPDAFRARTAVESASLVRSFGTEHKLDVGFGAELNIRQYVGLDKNMYDARIVADYQVARVPTSDSRAAPFVQVRAYESRFLHVHDFELLALQEDVRLGYDAFVRMYPVTRAIGSSRDFVGSDAFAQYVVPIGDGFARAAAESLLEIQSQSVPTSEVSLDATFVSPSFGFGRLVTGAILVERPKNYLNVRSILGGEGRLRGYPSGAFFGQNLFAYNTELRTRPIEILSCQLGGVAFYDMGDAFEGSSFRLKGSVGGGIRALFPQLDRRVWRVDVAVPLVKTPGTGPVGFYIAFEQAFPSFGVTSPGPGAAQGWLNIGGGALGQ